MVAALDIFQGKQAGQARKGVSHGDGIGQGVSLAKELGNLPGNVCTPVHLAREARKLASEKLKVRVYNRADIKRMKMGAFGAVGLSIKSPFRKMLVAGLAKAINWSGM